ncbi:MAG: DUF3106 domain-containing protein [Gallionella sp.]|nr:DUF3106 domain-containing protein [Gallionella sp.]
MRTTIIAVFLLLCVTGSSAIAAEKSWHSLTPVQQEALAPLSQQWDKLPELEQHDLLNTASRFPHLTPEQKLRFHSRLETWSKLTPTQRKAAREKYRAFKNVPTEKQEQVKQMVKQEQARREQTMKAQQAADGIPESVRK